MFSFQFKKENILKNIGSQISRKRTQVYFTSMQIHFDP